MLAQARHRGITGVIVLVIFLICTMVHPSAANATPSLGFGAYPAQGQPGQAVRINGANCPDFSTVWTVEAVLTDSANDQWVKQIMTTDSQGVWNKSAGVMIIDQNAAPGNASLNLRCVASGYADQVYNPTWFGITEQSDEMTFETALVGQTATLSSLPGSGCSANNPYDGVDVFTFGTTTSPLDGDIPWIDHLTADVSDANGNWSVNISIDPNKYTPGGEYFAIAECRYMSNFYTSFRFEAGRMYVAMGDSFSSGEGAFDYYTVSGGCHRSPYSYPVHLLAANKLVNSAFVACSGAVTDDLYHQNPINTSEVAQLTQLDEDTDVVTLTIGGNDIDFAGIMDECTSRSGHSGNDCRLNSAITTNLANRLSALAGTSQGTVTTPAPASREIHSIKEVLESIATSAPRAKIYIAGYPKLFGSSSSNYHSDSNSAGGYKCSVVGSSQLASVSFSDAQWLNGKANELNSVINDAVESLPQLDVTYVPPALFDGHALCDSSNPYILGVINDIGAITQSESFHPNRAGMEDGYAAAFSQLIN